MEFEPISVKGISPGLGMGIPLPTAGAETPAKSFGAFLADALAGVNAAQAHAGDMTKRFAAGENLDVHQVMIASQQAGVALNLALQVRNKVVDAYQEVMRIGM